MVPKSGSRLPIAAAGLSDSAVAGMISAALRSELGGTRQATKTVMRWTHVSDHTARSWLNGQTSPSSVHLLELATYSEPVMAAILKATGHDGLELARDLWQLEQVLQKALDEVRALRGK